MTGITVFYLFLALAGSLVLALIPYFYKEKSKRPKNWLLLASLRFLAFFGTALLLINPKIEQTSYSIEKKNLVLAVDNSRSIKNLKADSTVKQLVSKISGNEKITDRFSLQGFSLGNDLRPLDSLNFNEPQTDLSVVPEQLSQLYRKKDAPVILISDGNQTLGADYEYAFQSYNSAVFPVIVGDTTQYLDYKIDRLNVNRYAFLNNKFPVEIFIGRNETKATQHKLSIKRAGQNIFTTTITFDKGQTSVVEKALLSANAVGVQSYSVEIEPVENENNKDNNSRRFAVEVIDEHEKVLIATSFLHPDLGSLKKSIESNQQREATMTLINALDVDAVDLGKYQLVIRYQPDERFKALDEQIGNLGLNTFTIQGLQTDYGYENQRQDWYKKERSRQKEDYFAVLNPGYTAFQVNDFNLNNFPPLEDQFGSIDFKGAHEILLYQKINGITTETPMLATVDGQNQRKAVLFGEDIWRWRAEAFRQNGSFETYDNFLGKLIQLVSSNKSRDRLTLDYKSFYNSGEKLILKARYFDKNYAFDPRADLSILVSRASTKEEKQIPFVLKNQRYEVDLSSLKAGEYSFEVKVNGESLNKTGQFTILDFDVEKQFLNANYKKMNAIASDQVTFPDKIDNLIDQLIASKTYRPVQQKKINESPLINWVYLLFIIVSALAAEWFIRKYNGLT